MGAYGAIKQDEEQALKTAAPAQGTYTRLAVYVAVACFAAGALVGVAGTVAARPQAKTVMYSNKLTPSDAEATKGLLTTLGLDAATPDLNATVGGMQVGGGAGPSFVCGDNDAPLQKPAKVYTTKGADTVLMLDVDIPLGSDPEVLAGGKPFLHWLITGVSGCTDNKEATTVVEWFPPCPPDVAHRYVMLHFKGNATDLSSGVGRFGFDVAALVANNNLKVQAYNYLYTQPDPATAVPLPVKKNDPSGASAKKDDPDASKQAASHIMPDGSVMAGHMMPDGSAMAGRMEDMAKSSHLMPDGSVMAGHMMPDGSVMAGRMKDMVTQ